MAFAKGEANAGAAVQIARTGRNTFYEYFDDYPHALEVVTGRVLSRLDAALDATELIFHNPRGHSLVGRALCRLERYD